MKNMMKRAILLALALMMGLSCLSLASCSKKETIVIYTSAESFRIDYMNQRMKEQFPQYDIRIDYKSSGDQANLMKAAGKNVECHITHDLEYGNAADLVSLGVFADLTGVINYSGFVEDTVVSNFYAPELRNGGAIILNMDVITEKGLDEPTCYEDLLDPQYKGLVSMPNPKTSGTGYMFLLSLVNAWGEEEALQYFTALSENILAFESSGSGPVNKLITKEVAVGFGMISHAVQQINEGDNLKILVFEEGAPYSLYGQAVIAGNESNPAVMEVFNFLANDLTVEMCERFYPEKLYKDKDFTIKNFPTDVTYSDMSNNTPERKAQLLDKWTLS
ncbi:MAG: extracellular solute-binding protein [Clostridia bacterium]|nr:extracellular solute-binding protein [Clostridia bacterium]